MSGQGATDWGGTSTWLALHEAADSAQRVAEMSLRNGVRYRATGRLNLSAAADRNYLSGMTDARDLRATARDLL